MTTAIADIATRQQAGSHRRLDEALRALARAEATLLIRNRTALFNSVLIPVLLVAFGYQTGALDQPGVNPGGHLITTMALAGMLFVTYYNLVTTYVARRQELVLKRMRTGEIDDPTILAGTAIPTVLVSLLQLAVVSAAVPLLTEVNQPVNLLLPAVAFVLGTVIFALLAAASTAFTRTSETAQITTLPVLMVGTALSGVFFPLSMLPDGLAEVARLLPAASVVDLFNLGLSGTTRDGSHVDFAASVGEAVIPLSILAGWLIVGGLLVARYFRWEPRR